MRGRENRFTNQDYLREFNELLRVQGEHYPAITEHYEDIIDIYNSKRAYDDGPGSEKSPTPYGKWIPGAKEPISLIEKMRGKCTYFNKEPRIAAGAYTACLFNLLNDFNNLTIQGSPKEYLVADGKLNEKAKRYFIETFVNNGDNITLKRIAKYLGVKDTDISGYRIDKQGKAIFTEFKQYFAIRRIYDKFDREAEIHGNRELCDIISGILTKEKTVEKRQERLQKEGFDRDIADALATLKDFTQYHSLSLKAMECILGDLWETPKNQWVLFAQKGIQRQNRQKEALVGKEIPFDGEDWIVSPVTKRAVNETVKVINAARKMIKRQYGVEEFTNIVVEVACDNNSQEEKKRIVAVQKENEVARKAAQDRAKFEKRKLNDKQIELYRYLTEQEWTSIYSSKKVSFDDIVNNRLEIDHIIPRSISSDNSLDNKVAVFREENQAKGQRTPAQYLRSDYGEQAFLAFKKCVEKLFSNKKYRKKRENLLYEDDPKENMKGFINRSLVDTRYASREVLTLLRDYYKENNIQTDVKTVRGATTHYFRSKANLAKDREASHAHHAHDALIIAGLSNMQYIQKVWKWTDRKTKKIILENDRFVDQITGEVIQDEEVDNQAYLRFVSNVEKTVPQYSHKVDRKPNRQLYDANITATKIIDGKRYIIKEYKDIYGDNGKELKKKIVKEPEKLLMYHHDHKTFKKFEEIVKSYYNEPNPFAAYKEDKQCAIRKYSRKDNGPEIHDVKYISREAEGNFEDPKHKTSIREKTKSLRIDIYQDRTGYKFMRVPYHMIQRIENPKTRKVEYRIKEDQYMKEKHEVRNIGDDAKFVFSLYRGEVFSYEKKGKAGQYLFHGVKTYRDNTIEMKYIDKPNSKGERLTEKINSNIKNLRKYHVDVLGNRYPAPQEELQMKIEL
ncbi:MAG: type II CRISPR RNA-guided endonuclease Cas9 [Selenomonadales bacterium]|nr:type II CRISPR RNA-guided endonuclease Cas9 [Selenomonadales bacterium]